MQFRLRTLGIVVAWFAVAFAIGKFGDAFLFLLYVGGSGVVLTPLIANVWVRVSVAFLLTAGSVECIGALIILAFRDDGQASLLEGIFEPAPVAVTLGAMAVVISCFIRAAALGVYREYFGPYGDRLYDSRRAEPTRDSDEPLA